MNWIYDNNQCAKIQKISFYKTTNNIQAAIYPITRNNIQN